MRVILFFLLLATGIHAQTFAYDVQTFNNGEPSEMQGVPGDLFMANVTFTNNTNAPIRIFMDRYQKTIPPYWAVCYCYIMCHSPAEDTITVNLPAFSSTMVTIQFKTDSVNPGITNTDYKIFDRDLPQNVIIEKMTASTMGPVSVREQLGNRITRLYPNPADGTLFVSGLTGSDKIEIVDAQGKMCPVNRTFGAIDVSQYHPGLYFVKITGPYAGSVTKFIKH